MVAGFWKILFIIVVWGSFSGGCSNDLLGLFFSTDINDRWRARNTFNFLSYEDRNILLGDSYSFIVVTDPHIHNRNAFGLERLKDIIDDDIKFVVINGDITQNGKQEDLEKFIQIANSLGVPCYPVAGNHDVYFGNWHVWKKLIGSTCYSVNGDSATLLILDSANAFFGARQLDWLEKELSKAKGRVFVFSHVNLFVGNPFNIQQFTDVRERARITSLLKGRCDIMFMGHSHQRLIREIGGVKYITIEDFRDNTVYCQVWVTEDGIRWEFKKL